MSLPEPVEDAKVKAFDDLLADLDSCNADQILYVGDVRDKLRAQIADSQPDKTLRESVRQGLENDADENNGKNLDRAETAVRVFREHFDSKRDEIEKEIVAFGVATLKGEYWTPVQCADALFRILFGDDCD